MRSDEQGEVAEILLAAYRAIPGNHLAGGYSAELADVASRSREAEVLVAVRHSPDAERDEVAGCVTFVPDASSPWAELLEAGDCGIRMLAVRPDAQRRGTGRLLVSACIERARALGRASIVLHTTPWMTAARRLYEEEGFERFPSRDWSPFPDVPLHAYRLELDVVDGTAAAAESAQGNGAVERCGR